MKFSRPNIPFACNKIYTKSVLLISLLSFYFLLFNFQAKSQVVINEVGIGASKDQGTGGEFIELFNRSGCSVDISCYVLVYSATTYSSAGWSVTIPGGTILSSGQYYLIGGNNSNLLFGTSWTNGVKGTTRTWSNGYGLYGKDLADLDLGTAYTSGKAIIIGNLVNSGGQVTLLKPNGSVATSLAYNTGNNSGTYPCSINANGCSLTSVLNPGAVLPYNDGSNFSSFKTGLYLDANNIYRVSYYPDPSVYPTPGKANPSQLSVTPAPVATISASGPTTFCAGGSVTLNASAGSSWLWSNGATTQSILVSTAGSYTVTITDGYGCSATSSTTFITVNSKPNPTIYHN